MTLTGGVSTSGPCQAGVTAATVSFPAEFRVALLSDPTIVFTLDDWNASVGGPPMARNERDDLATVSFIGQAADAGHVWRVEGGRITGLPSLGTFQLDLAPTPPGGIPQARGTFDATLVNDGTTTVVMMHADF